jgi:enoyl-CoA hydratase/carnithine racemase
LNPSPAHAELIATFKRAEADAAHKFGLIKAAEKKGPKSIQKASETAAKAARRRDVMAARLAKLGVVLPE